MFSSVLGANCIHPVGACHSYPLAVFVTTYPVVAVHHGANDVGTAHPSLISFPVVWSNTAKCPSVAEAGHTTSPTGTVTAQVCPFTEVTHQVGAKISFQLAAVEYGATLST